MCYLDIAVKLQAKGTLIDSGLWFSFYPSKTDCETTYLKDAAGNIEIPASNKGNVQINFVLETSQLTIGSKQYKASFQLADGASAQKTLAITQGVNPQLPATFKAPEFPSGSTPSGPPNKVSTTSLGRDDVSYDYMLKVGLTPAGGRTTNVGHDPKIKNGGTAFHWGIENPLTAVLLVVSGVLVTLACQRLLKSKITPTPKTEHEPPQN